MAYQPKSYRKFLAGTVSAAVVASAIAPVASASFTDVAGSVHADDIATLVAKGYIKGYADGTFKPNKTLTRGEAAIIFSRILKDAGFKAPEQGASFPDVPASKAELAEAVAIVKAAGVMGGDEKGNFNPNANITREQMAKVVVEAFKLTKPANHTTKITDLDKAGSWAREYIQTLEANGVTKNTEFMPKQNVTRGQFASFVVRAMDVKKEASAADITAVKLVDEKTLEVTFNGELKEVKKEDFAIQGVEIDSVSIKATAAAEAKTTVVVIKTKTALQEGKSYNVSYKGQTTDKAKVDVPVVTPKVESVSAINAKQIEVKFNTKMDKDSVTDVTKYAIKRAGVASVALTNNSSATDATASLSEDGKTLTITLNNALTSPTWSIAEGDSFNFEIGKLKAANGKEIEAQSVSIKYSDKVAPNLVSATAKAATTTRTVTLKFSEPVDFATTGVFKVNGQVATPSAGSDVREVVLTTSQSLTAGQKYTVEVTNLKDLAGNLITPNPVSLDFTVTQDNTADGIDSVTVQGDNQVKVVFKEPMDSSTVTAAGNIKLVDANGNAITNVSVAPVANSNNKEYTITVGQGTNLYANADTNTVNVIFTNAIKDASGNAITPETRTVTFTKDKVAPKVSKVQLIAPGDTYDGVAYANGALLLTFDEKVLRPADGGTPGNFTKSKIQVIDQDGTVITDALFSAGATISGTVLDSKDNAKLVIPFTAAPASTVKTATVRLVASAVTDASLGANGNAAATVTGVDFTTSVADTQKPVISAASVAGGSGNTITFTITEANLDKSTVLDINNYRLDGAPLPDGSYVTINSVGSTHTVTVHLPAGSISKTRTNYAFTISGIKDKAGNTADVVAVNNVSLTDDVQPVLTAGRLNNDGTITLTYSEAVTGVAPSDLVVTLNGKTVASTALTVNNITEGSDNGGSLVKIAVGFDDGGDGASTGNEKIFIDVAGGTAGQYDAGTDILLATGTYANAAAYNNGYILASDVVTLKVSTAATGTLTGQDAAGNKLANGKSVTIK
ncbi:hypothetical protein HNQ82_000840 [Anoxybacillus tengchongensis]|uniref:SLH domain-containing protein n=1 Tax=Anoxybacillus tengchongensis TaxID=576944 RepID=A0A7X0DAE4_9BACL|nr:S-layer homology domain-containing protein [Anoxybacillus tengchongensis]MBB6176029.1 hypothetical protein [Anoxybacillus tengchongensis]